MTNLQKGPIGGPMSDLNEKEEVVYDENSVPMK